MRFSDIPRSFRTQIALLLGATVFLTGGLDAQAQAPGQPGAPNLTNRAPESPFAGIGPTDPVIAARQARAMNTARQKSLISDTDKLLKLAQELKAEVDNGNRSALTPVQLRKIADIEKLARNVKQKMGISFSNGQLIDEFEESIPPRFP
jgi:hypothetical protein